MSKKLTERVKDFVVRKIEGVKQYFVEGVKSNLYLADGLVHYDFLNGRNYRKYGCRI